MAIISPHNPRIKHVVRLRGRRQREREGLTLVEGYEALSLALACGARPRTLFHCPALSGPADAADLLGRARQAGAEVIEVGPAIFEKVAFRENPDGWMAVVPAPRRRLADLALGPNPLLVVAESIEKPGNLGAMLRSADAAGAAALIVCDPATDVSNPNVVQSSRGALFSLPVVEADGAEALAWLRERGIAIVAGSPQAELLYTQADLGGPLAIAVGTEKEGLSRTWLEQADLVVRIPMFGRVNSLNVATAAALLLYEAVRQRQDKGPRIKDQG